MKFLKNHSIFSLLNSYIQIDSPQPVNISYLWNFGSLLGIGLIIQIITGITLAMHYTPSIDAAFISVEHIMRNVNYGWLIIQTNTNTIFLTDGVNIESIQSAPLFPFFFLKINNKGKQVVDYINSFDFVKGVKYAAALPVLPPKIANYHKSLLGRILRVVGGLSAFILLTNKTELSLINLEPRDFIFYSIAFTGIAHMFYILSIFTIKSSYVLYYILTGKWIHRNSPLKYIFTEGSGSLLCIKGLCFVSGAWFAAAGLATEFDDILGQNYFKQLAIIKQPVVFLKSTIEVLDESIYFGNPDYLSKRPLMSDNSNLNENAITSNSEILNILNQLEELDKLKSKIASNPEIKQAFDKIKTELNVDIVKDFEEVVKLVKK